MERILRGDLRFSCGGFTYLRIASRLYIKAERETSAHTGRRTSLGGLFCVPAMGLPNKIVYAIQASSTRRQMGCRVNDNNLATQRPFFLRASERRAFGLQGCCHSRGSPSGGAWRTPEWRKLFYSEDPWQAHKRVPPKKCDVRYGPKFLSPP